MNRKKVNLVVCAILVACSTLLWAACERRLHEFEYVYLKFNDGTDTTFVNCVGGIDRGGKVWIIRTDSTRKNYPLSNIKEFDWKYTLDEVIKQKLEITISP